MRKKQSAFTLVEVMIVVAIIADILIVAVPGLMRAKQSAQNARFEEDLRIASSAFMMYYTENGSWPADSAAGVIPPGMTIYLKGMDFTGGTPLGGNWNWDVNAAAHQAGISVLVPNSNFLQMQRIDTQIDDGVLSTGAFQNVSADTYSYSLEY